MNVSADDMTRGKRAVSALLLLGAMGGFAACSSPSVESMLPPVQRASAGPVSPDGKYDGQLIANGSVGPDNGACGGTDSIGIGIRNSQFRLVLAQPQIPYRRQLAFEVTVAPDGTFNTVNGPNYVRGKVAEGHLQGQASGDACTYDILADRNGTW